jgi:RimJ/RimL family protein N-acetyltransferase
MHLIFTKLIQPDLDFFTKLADWYCDPAIKYAIRPNFQACEMPDLTVQELIDGFGRNPTKQVYRIDDQDAVQVIGEVTLDYAFPLLYRQDIPSAWISVLIGEQAYWGRGVGTRAMQFLEEVTRSLGLRRIELGVFAFNEPAIRLYNRLGYQEIGRKDHFTYRPDQWYDDIRMEKWL